MNKQQHPFFFFLKHGFISPFRNKKRDSASPDSQSDGFPVLDIHLSAFVGNATISSNVQ